MDPGHICTQETLGEPFAEISMASVSSCPGIPSSLPYWGFWWTEIIPYYSPVCLFPLQSWPVHSILFHILCSSLRMLTLLCFVFYILPDFGFVYGAICGLRFNNSFLGICWPSTIPWKDYAFPLWQEYLREHCSVYDWRTECLLSPSPVIMLKSWWSRIPHNSIQRCHLESVMSVGLLWRVSVPS